MCDNNNNNSCGCFTDTLCTIVTLQKQVQCLDEITSGCDRPFLGGNITNNIFNTRPVSLYPCGSNALWSMPFTLNETVGESTVFRVETVDDCCATFRILAPNPDTTSMDPYVATDSFFTMNLNCVGVLRCLPDTHIACI